MAKKIGEPRLLRIEPDEKLEIDKTTVFALKAKHKYGLEGVARAHSVFSAC